MYKSALAFLCLVAVGVQGYGPKFEAGEPAKPFPEIPCTAEGGICVVANDCPAGKLAKIRGLCPMQQRKGVECCYGVGKSETTCRGNGGQCILKTSPCPDNLNFRSATDCDYDQKCCILVRK